MHFSELEALRKLSQVPVEAEAGSCTPDKTHEAVSMAIPGRATACVHVTLFPIFVYRKGQMCGCRGARLLLYTFPFRPVLYCFLERRRKGHRDVVYDILCR